jgi:hypothetical protein
MRFERQDLLMQNIVVWNTTLLVAGEDECENTPLQSLKLLIVCGFLEAKYSGFGVVSTLECEVPCFAIGKQFQWEIAILHSVFYQQSDLGLPFHEI